MGPNLRYLLEMMRRYPLADRSKEVRNLLPLIERGLLNEGMAAAVLIQIQPLIARLEQRPNYLVRAPEYDELYPDGPPRAGCRAFGGERGGATRVVPSGSVPLSVRREDWRWKERGHSATCRLD